MNKTYLSFLGLLVLGTFIGFFIQRMIDDDWHVIELSSPESDAKIQIKNKLTQAGESSVEEDDSELEIDNNKDIHTDLKRIGKLEILDFPDLQLYGIKTKIDTGAKTSSIHCHFIRKITKHGKTYVAFKLLDAKHPFYNNKLHIYPIFSEKDIKSSSGDIEHRLTIRTQVIIFNTKLPIELALTDRSYMKIPVLIGREFLKNRFIVDVSKINLSYASRL